MSPGMQRGVQMRRAGPARKGAFLAGASVLAIMIATGAAAAAVFDFTGGEVEYTVPLTGLYDIVAAGAQGASPPMAEPEGTALSSAANFSSPRARSSTYTSARKAGPGAIWREAEAEAARAPS